MITFLRGPLSLHFCVAKSVLAEPPRQPLHKAETSASRFMGSRRAIGTTSAAVVRRHSDGA